VTKLTAVSTQWILGFMPQCSQPLLFYITENVSLLYRLYSGSFDFIFDSLYADALDDEQTRAA
jgi:hypothetical protein